MVASVKDLDLIRNAMRAHYLADENACLSNLVNKSAMTLHMRKRIEERAVTLVDAVRASGKKSLIEVFMVEYGLSSEEGVALMCLAEALLRVPDVSTISALIENKITPLEWKRHLGQAESALVNASTWGLLLSANVLRTTEGKILGGLRGLVKRLGEPVIRSAVVMAVKELARQFVLGRDIQEAIRVGEVWRNKGYGYSYDMLGEAACNEVDAERYFLSYADAITTLTPHCKSKEIAENPGVSIKLSALYSRYEPLHKDQVMDILVSRTRSLALLAKSANMGFNIDAEEADRLDLSLDVIQAVLSDPSLEGWDGFGVVVQAYGQRATYVLDWLYALAIDLDRRIMVRLVKGAYWDAEIKRAQTLGLDGFPVFTRKAATDMSWISCARQLFAMQDHIYPQFATHNAHSMAAILELAPAQARYEFQRLHGMGEILHDKVAEKTGARCRIYAPVGSHEDLLAYLVRRLLENGANSSFVQKIGNPEISPSILASDPFKQLDTILAHQHHRGVAHPSALFGEGRQNSRGFDVTDPVEAHRLQKVMSSYLGKQWVKGSSGGVTPIVNPANQADVVGRIKQVDLADMDAALKKLDTGHVLCKADRLTALRAAADLFEAHHAELFALLQREAGKTILDAIAELREAVDFLRFYADEAEGRPDTEEPAGSILCISPWNFPLAIFTGQIAAALAMGNKVIAKPAEQTPLVALRAVELLHEAGIPQNMLQFIPGEGPVIGEYLLQNKAINGVCFTGSTVTAQLINRQMADNLYPHAMLIAETGGLNAMVVDSTAQPEQVVRDVIASGFQSAGQRCSALRMLYLQDEIADKIMPMLQHAMDSLIIGDPADWSTDVGPVIDMEAKNAIDAHIAHWKSKGAILKQLHAPEEGSFVGPALIRVRGIADIEKEIFGPVIHVATFRAEEYDNVIGDINATGYGLTFCLHSRLDDRIARTCEQVHAGNIYINRNQIGAIVGSQPFGGEGLSGTGPKAGGPDYLSLFVKQQKQSDDQPCGKVLTEAEVQQALDLLPLHEGPVGEAEELPGPTGESNRLFKTGKGRFILLCEDTEKLSPVLDKICAKNASVLVIGSNIALASPPVGSAVSVIDGQLHPSTLTNLQNFSGVVSLLSDCFNSQVRQALSVRKGAILPLIAGDAGLARLYGERHISIDTTATGGNASLLAASE